jgi:biotin carboxyl carrier protein
MAEPEDPTTLVVDETAYETTLTHKFALRKPYRAGDPRLVTAHIPGLIKRVHVRAGQRVRRGEALLVLEAMKMANDLGAPNDGTIKAVHVAAGTMVGKGQLLIELE